LATDRVQSLSAVAYGALRLDPDRHLAELNGKPRGAAIATTIEIGNVGGLQAAVQCGLGVTIVPLATVEPPSPGVIVRRFTDLDIEVPVGIARRPNGPPPNAALQAHLAILRSRLSAHVGGDAPDLAAGRRLPT
jgi:DNA-binding transcriptional LysR family regulator